MGQILFHQGTHQERGGRVYYKTCLIYCEFPVLLWHWLCIQRSSNGFICFTMCNKGNIWQVFWFKRVSQKSINWLSTNPKLEAVSLNLLAANQLRSEDCFIVVFAIRCASSQVNITLEMIVFWSGGRLVGGQYGAQHGPSGRSGDGRIVAGWSCLLQILDTRVRSLLFCVGAWYLVWYLSPGARARSRGLCRCAMLLLFCRVQWGECVRELLNTNKPLVTDGRTDHSWSFEPDWEGHVRRAV